MKANKFLVSGFTNVESYDDIERSINLHQGINAVRLDTLANTVTVDYDDARYGPEDIKSFVSEAGLTVEQDRKQ